MDVCLFFIYSGLSNLQHQFVVIEKRMSSMMYIFSVTWGTCLSCCEMKLYSMYTTMYTRLNILCRFFPERCTFSLKLFKRESSSGCSQLLSLHFLLMINFNVLHDATEHSQEMLQHPHLLTSKLLRQQGAETKAKLTFPLALSAFLLFHM